MAAKPSGTRDVDEGKGALDAFLSGIERVGNMVPHPAIIFFILIGDRHRPVGDPRPARLDGDLRGYDAALGEIVTQTTTVRSLLSADGIRFMLTSPVANFLGFTGVGVIIVAMIGVGVAEESGLIATLVRKIVAIAPRSIFTFIIVMLGVVSSIAADAGYLVLVPLGAAAFHSLGRHPLAGLAAALLRRGGGVPRQRLRHAHRRAAGRDDQRRDPRWSTRPREITVVGNLYFMIASSILMGIVCTLLTEKFVEPHLGPYTGGVPGRGARRADRGSSAGAESPGCAFLGFVVVIGLLTAPPLPWGVLRNPETGGIMSGSPFMSGLIILISALFLAVGYAYGNGAGTIKNVTAAIGMIVKTFASMAGLIFLLLVIAKFIAFFNFTNLATVLAVNLADFLQTVPIGATGYIVIFVLVIALIDI